MGQKWQSNRGNVKRSNFCLKPTSIIMGQKVVRHLDRATYAPHEPLLLYQKGLSASPNFGLGKDINQSMNIFICKAQLSGFDTA